MTVFNWPQFLSRNRIEYVTFGPNVSRGKIAIKCVFCGAADPSQHLAITLATGAWKCWRHRDHRGLQPARLVAALLRCSLDQARALVYGEDSVQLPDDFMSRINGHLRPEPIRASQTVLAMPREFLPFKDLPSARPFVSYLCHRGFEQRQIWTLTRDYGVRYCTRGAFASRVIFPVYFGGKLVNWTARTISQRERLRYKTLSVWADSVRDVPAAVGPISNYLLWCDQLRNWGGETLVLCEGPIDALKLNVLGRRHGIVATCFFTNRPTQAQTLLLHELVPRFRRTVLLLDADMQAMSFRVGRELAVLAVEVAQLPSGVGDPGELQQKHIEKLFL